MPVVIGATPLCLYVMGFISVHVLCTSIHSLTFEIWVDVEVQCNVLFPRPYGGAYSHSPIPQLEQDVGMGHLFPLEILDPSLKSNVFLSGSAEQDALTMKESSLKNLILMTDVVVTLRYT